MARGPRIVWAAPALDELDEIAAFIADGDPRAAAGLVHRVFASLERLRRFPASGRRLPELPNGPYREVIVAPCRIIYRTDRAVVHIVHVTRGERPLRPHQLK
ncbi:MAG TPA: type II toxin-antitoxin system RelE/ParE family toxin [Kofleriaceae bacterium]|nr:type II toxin-antitoxin system RelE/ParE family toxin [Kofleriaceae bacterium]